MGFVVDVLEVFLTFTAAEDQFVQLIHQLPVCVSDDKLLFTKSASVFLACPLVHARSTCKFVAFITLRWVADNMGT